MRRNIIEERCVFDDYEQSPEEIVESIISDLEKDLGEINWHEAKSVVQYINDAVEDNEDPSYIYENAYHRLEELDL